MTPLKQIAHPKGDVFHAMKCVDLGGRRIIKKTDLRAGAALVIAGLAADGITTVDDIRFIERGYEDFTEKLRGIGASIEKVEDERALKKFMFQVS